MDYNTNIETDLSLTNFNFQFVSTRAPRAAMETVVQNSSFDLEIMTIFQY